MTQTIAHPETHRSYSWSIQHTEHSRKRSSQRGISEENILLALDYGDPIFKQGLIFYVVLERNLPDNINHAMREKINNLVIVVSPKNNEIVTCYKSNHARHHIRKKNNYLN